MEMQRRGRKRWRKRKGRREIPTEMSKNKERDGREIEKGR